MKLDRYLAIYHEDFRYFRDQSNNDSLSIIHPILVSVSNQLDSYVKFYLSYSIIKTTIDQEISL